MKKFAAAFMLALLLCSCDYGEEKYEGGGILGEISQSDRSIEEKPPVTDGKDSLTFAQESEMKESRRSLARKLIELCELLDIGPFSSPDQIGEDKLIAFAMIFPDEGIKKSENGATISAPVGQVKKSIEKYFGIEDFWPSGSSEFYKVGRGTCEMVATGLGDDVEISCRFHENDEYMVANTDVKCGGDKQKVFYIFEKTADSSLRFVSKETALQSLESLYEGIEI